MNYEIKSAIWNWDKLPYYGWLLQIPILFGQLFFFFTPRTSVNKWINKFLIDERDEIFLVLQKFPIWWWPPTDLSLNEIGKNARLYATRNRLSEVTLGLRMYDTCTYSFQMFKTTTQLIWTNTKIMNEKWN